MYRSISTRLIGGLILASAFAGFAPTALADAANSYGPAESVTVHYDDLNLEAEAGAKALVNRIAAAATLVCGGQQDFRFKLGARLRFETCRTSATQSAIAKVDHPRVTAIYESKQSTDKRLASR